MTARAFVFPGQGSQTVGMGRDLAEASPVAARVFEEVDDALGEKLSAILWEGPAETLTLTRNTQPGLMAVSLAAMRLLEDRSGRKLADLAQVIAGHSLGEYSALTAAGSLSIGDAARLLRTRGDAMQAAVPQGQGAMAAILGLEIDRVREIAQEAEKTTGGVCAAANDNAPGQVVVSGATAAVEAAIALAKDAGAKRALPLPVSAPFHCALMAPAAEVMSEALANVTIQAPGVALIANVTASPVTDPVSIRQLLVEQVTASVRWRESVTAMADQGIDTLVEVGAGKVLTGLTGRIDKRLTGTALNTVEAVDAFVATVS